MAPFSKRSAKLTGVSSFSTTRPIRKKRLQAYRGRGDIYAWLRTHCHTVAERLASGETSWTLMADEMSRHGVAGRDGGAPKPNAVLRVWQRVCRDMAASGETPGQKANQPRPPSRFPKDWSPKVVREQDIPVPAYLRPAGAEVPPYLRPPSTLPAISAPPAQAPESRKEVVDQTPRPEPGSVEFVMEQLRDDDWYLNPGVKRRRP